MDRQIVRLTLACSAVLGGCATQATLTVYTVPAGGTVVQSQNGATIGIAPAVLSYPAAGMRQYKDASGCFLVGGVESRWVSGAVSKSASPIQLCGGTETGAYQITLVRDGSYPGIEKDNDYAVQLGKFQIQQQRAQAATNAANMAATAAIVQSLNPSTAPQVGGGAAQGPAFLKRQYVSGFNRICVYNRMGSEVAVTIGSAELCQISLP